MGGNPDYKIISDAQLIRLLRNSDSSAFSEIFRRSGPEILLFTFKRVKDMQKSKLLIRDVFTDIWESRHVIDIPGELRLFLIDAIKAKIIEYYRHAHVSQQFIDDFNAYLSLAENKKD